MPITARPNRSVHASLFAMAICFQVFGVVGLFTLVPKGWSQSVTFAGNAQHTAQFAAPSQNLNRVRWSVALEAVNTSAHYAAPLITVSNTVVVAAATNPIATVKSFDGATGRLKYTLTTDFHFLTSTWRDTYSYGLAAGPSGTRLYYAGGGGTVFYIDNPDSDAPGAPVRLCFYAPLSVYSTNSTAFNTSIFVDTPITTDTNGTIFFGFRVVGTAPAPLNTMYSGFARIAWDGSASYVLTGVAAGDSTMFGDSNDCAPALSNDGTTLYVAVKTGTSGHGYLLGLDTTTLATKFKTLLRDPRNGSLTGPVDYATASPTVGPDGDVYLGVGAVPDNNSRGYMLHFSANLATNKLPACFGWDHTPAIVPTNLVAGYAGSSSYLLASKYNDYSGFVGLPHRIAILDPNAAQTSAFPGDSTIPYMREVLSMATPSSREWCINTFAVHLPTASLFAPNEDGKIYRWNLLSNSLIETLSLNSGIGEPYVPTVVAPDGAIYTISGSKLFALDNVTNLAVSAYSSAPDDRNTTVGQTLTFTAVVTDPTGAGPLPDGTVNFLLGISTLATNVPLTNGMAAISISNLNAGNNYITVRYSGNASYPTGAVTLVQRIHAKSTVLNLTSTVPTMGSNSVTFSAAVTSIAGGTPTGMVAFWDRTTFLGQVPLATNQAIFTTTNLGVGQHAVRADYNSDVTFASSSGAVLGTSGPLSSAAILPDGTFQLTFTNVAGAPFSVVGSPDLTVPVSAWSVLGPAIEVLPGQFEFHDTQNTSAFFYYRVKSP